MAKKASGRGGSTAIAKTKARAKPKPRARKAKEKKIERVRFVCRECNSAGRGGYFTATNEKTAKCPHCNSTKVKLLA